MAKQTKEKIKSDIYKFLKKNGVMTLATQSKNGPWVCTLYYGIDPEINLYVLTDPSTEHGKNMLKNNQVAFNIFNSNQKIYNPKKGLQGTGKIYPLKNIQDAAKALYLWHKQNPGVEKKITIQDVKKIKDTKMWKIIPTKLKFFNKTLYSPEDYGIINM